MIRVAVFASGSGTTLQAILDAFTTPPGSDLVHITVVVSNNPSAYALERARRSGVPVVVADHRGRSRDAFEADLASAVDRYGADLICLAGFLRILSPAFVSRYSGRILNTHPALLPAFGGKGMYGERVHRAVLAARSATSGCTIHVVDEVPDGGPIVAQRVIPVLDGDTLASLADRVQEEERRLYPDVIRWWAEGRVQIGGRTVMLHPSSPPNHPPGEPAARPLTTAS